MKNSRDQILRRVEIIGMAAAEPERYTLEDLANLFDVDEETLKKDMQIIRSLGIDIHKPKKSGLIIDGQPQLDILTEQLFQYLAMTHTDEKSEKFLEKFVQKQKLSALGMIVTIQQAISDKRILLVKYKQSNGKGYKDIEVGPLKLFFRAGMWRLLGLNGKYIIQLHLAKIKSVERLNKGFERPPENDIENMFRFSWDIWTGVERIPVKLKINEWWADRLSANPAVEDQKIEEQDNGEYYFSGTVNSLEEVARWIMATTGDVVVVEPPQLKEHVKKLFEKLAKTL
jgi:predicted DNA-binding transcriptional regulator YafY